MAKALDASAHVPLPVVFKGLLTTPDEIRATLLEANGDAGCAGVILWMHTFSPSRMWIGGLRALQKPFAASAHAVQPRSAVGSTSTWTS